MRTGSRFPLDSLEAQALLEPAVVGPVHTGSVGRGGGDLFSDLDFDVVLDPSASDHAVTVVLRLCAMLGPIHFSYWRGAMLTAFVAEPWQRVDLRYTNRQE